jgi:phage replication initiation protein
MASRIHSDGITGVGSTGFVDYIAFTLPQEVDLAEAVVWLLQVPLDRFVKADSGRFGYHVRYEMKGITLLTDGGTDDMGHNITLTGVACHAYQDSLKDIAAKVFVMGGHFTRCDLAIDDRQGVLDMEEMQQAVAGGLVVARFAKTKKFDEHDRKTGRVTGRGLYFGSRKSEMFIRIYDKALEQRVDYHWIRVELELKDGKADAVMRLAVQDEIGGIAGGVLRDQLSFRQPGNGVNRSRWPVSPWWKLFLSNVEKLKLVSEKQEPASQEARLLWFVSNAATFAELYDVCGPGIIPYMYLEGKQRMAVKEVAH